MTFDGSYVDNPVFSKEEVLLNKYIPDHLLFRDKEMDEIEVEIGRHMRTGGGTHFHIWGPTSTGKTHAIKRIQKNFYEWRDEKGINGDMIYLNCRDKSLYNIVVGLNRKFSQYPQQGKSMNTVYEDLLQRLSDKKYVIVFDEIDEIKKTPWSTDSAIDDLIYKFSRAHEFKSHVELMIIMISNKSSILDTIKSYNRSQLQQDKVFFSRYNADELCEIIRDRVEMAFKDGIVDDSVINLLAARVVSGSKSVRDALKALMKAGHMISNEMESNEEPRQMTMDDIDEAFDIIESDHIRTTIEGLGPHEFAVLVAVANENGKVDIKTMYDNYRKFIKELGMDSNSYRYLRSNHIPSLEDQGLILTELKGRGKGRGTTSFVSQAHSDIPTLVKEAIATIDKYKPLLEYFMEQQHPGKYYSLDDFETD